jgi:hypothetical protein
VGTGRRGCKGFLDEVLEGGDDEEVSAGELPDGEERLREPDAAGSGVRDGPDKALGVPARLGNGPDGREEASVVIEGNGEVPGRSGVNVELHVHGMYIRRDMRFLAIYRNFF